MSFLIVRPQRPGGQECAGNPWQSGEDMWFWTGSRYYEWFQLCHQGQRETAVSFLFFYVDLCFVVVRVNVYTHYRVLINIQMSPCSSLPSYAYQVFCSFREYSICNKSWAKQQHIYPWASRNRLGPFECKPQWTAVSLLAFISVPFIRKWPLS